MFEKLILLFICLKRINKGLPLFNKKKITENYLFFFFSLSYYFYKHNIKKILLKLRKQLK